MITVTTTQQERFQYMRKEILNLSQKTLADKLQTSQQNVADIETGRKKKIDSDILYALLTEFDINVEWLLFGTGNITKIDDAMESSEAMPDTIISIPFYNALASAGNGVDAPELEEKDLLYFDKRMLKNILGLNPKNLSIVRATGNSMDGGSKPIKDRDFLLVDSTIKEGDGKVFVFKEDGELFVKQLRFNMDDSIEIISFNPEYPARVLTSSQLMFNPIEIIGRVMWNGSMESV